MGESGDGLGEGGAGGCGVSAGVGGDVSVGGVDPCGEQVGQGAAGGGAQAQ